MWCTPLQNIAMGYIQLQNNGKTIMQKDCKHNYEVCQTIHCGSNMIRQKPKQWKTVAFKVGCIGMWSREQGTLVKWSVEQLLMVFEWDTTELWFPDVCKTVTMSFCVSCCCNVIQKRTKQKQMHLRRVHWKLKQNRETSVKWDHCSSSRTAA